MPINLETPRKFEQLISQAHQVATEIFRPNSRKYDSAEHEYPKELDMLAAVIDGMNEGGGIAGAGAGAVGGRENGAERGMAIGSDGVQLLGGHGYVKEHPVERWYRDLRAAGLMEGALVV